MFAGEDDIIDELPANTGIGLKRTGKAMFKWIADGTLSFAAGALEGCATLGRMEMASHPTKRVTNIQCPTEDTTTE